MEKREFAKKIRALIDEQGISKVRWFAAYRQAEFEREVNKTKDYADIILDGRRPVPKSVRGLTEWFWAEFDQVYEDTKQQEAEIADFFADYEERFAGEETY